MQKLKEALSVKAKSKTVYKGMKDARTKRPTGGEKCIFGVRSGEDGDRGVDIFLTGSYKTGKENGYYDVQLSEFQRFEGEIVDGEVNGIGTLTNTSDGCHETYTGEWKAGLMHGFGKFVDKVKNSTYIGEFKDGLYHGHGRLEDEIGEFYEGDFYFG